MSVASQLVRSDVKLEVAKAKRPRVFRHGHLFVALRIVELEWLLPFGETDHRQTLSSPAPWSSAARPGIIAAFFGVFRAAVNR